MELFNKTSDNNTKLQRHRTKVTFVLFLTKPNMSHSDLPNTAFNYKSNPTHCLHL